MSVGIPEIVLVIVVIVILFCPDKLPALITSTKKVAANVTDASNKVKADITEAMRDSDEMD